MIYKSAVSLICLFFLFSCSSHTIKLEKTDRPTPVASPQGTTLYEIKRLDLQGENCCFSPGPKQDQFLFISKKRPKHSQAQVYLWLGESGKERRLTFHDGDDQGASLSADGKTLYYASTTDANKESPDFLKNSLSSSQTLTNPAQDNQMEAQNSSKPYPTLLWNQGLYDLYQANLDGTDIQRLTHQLIYQAEPTLNMNNNYLIYVETHLGIPKLFQLSLNSKERKMLSKAQFPEAEPKISPSGKQIVWVRFNSDYTESQLWIAQLNGKNSRSVTSGPGLKLNPSWSPDESKILFSSNQSDPSNFELYGLITENLCQTRFTYLAGHDLQPVWPAESGPLYFTRRTEEKSQLYSLDLKTWPTCAVDPSAKSP